MQIKVIMNSHQIGKNCTSVDEDMGSQTLLVRSITVFAKSKYMYSQQTRFRDSVLWITIIRM